MSSWDKSANSLCKSHSVKSDRELYRICPSKLSKGELEDLYFTVLENNLELKKTINGHQEKIRLLSTKIQRITNAQKSLQAKEPKECCGTSKAIVNEQLQTIRNLQKQNEKQTERIKVLNMRLCSAKQFLKRNPLNSVSKCLKCTNSTTPYLRDTSNSPKPCGTGFKSVSCQNLDRDEGGVKSIDTETQTNQLQNKQSTSCDKNKCRNLMDELKQKILFLEEELSHTHEEYSTRLSRLEREVIDVREENVRVRSERAQGEHALQHRAQHANMLADSLRDTKGQCAELKVLLAIEKSRVTELETRLKMSEMSNSLNKTIEEHIAALDADTQTNMQKDLKTESSPSTASKRDNQLTESEEKNYIAGPTDDILQKNDADTEELRPDAHTEEVRSDAQKTGDEGSCKHNKSTKMYPVFEPIIESPTPTLDELCKLHKNQNKIDVIRIDVSPDDKMSKSSDDSGYAESGKGADRTPKSNTEGLKSNVQLLKKINDLQEELESLKAATATAPNSICNSKIKPQIENMSVPQQVMRKAQEIFATADIPHNEELQNDPLDTSTECKPSSTPKRNSLEQSEKQLYLINDTPNTSILNQFSATGDECNEPKIQTDKKGAKNCKHTKEMRVSDHDIPCNNQPVSSPIVDCLLKDTNVGVCGSKEYMATEADDHNKDVQSIAECSGKLKKDFDNFSSVQSINKEDLSQKILGSRVTLNDKIEVIPHAQKSTPSIRSSDVSQDHWCSPSSIPVNKDDPCEKCERCRYSQECKQNITDFSCENKRKFFEKSTLQRQKADTHNSMQIPGPLPVTTNQFANEKSFKRNPKKDGNQIKTTDKKDINSDSTAMKPSNKIKLLTASKDSIDVLKSKENEHKPQSQGQEVSSLNNYYLQTTPVGLKAAMARMYDQSCQSLNKKVPEYPVVRREVKTYRRPSGTLCFDTTPEQSAKTRTQREEKRLLDTNETQTEAPSCSRRLSWTSDKGTYTVDSKKSQAPSLEGTEHEISSMTDLPYEKDAKTQYEKRPLSPGECTRNKTTSTCTESSTSPMTDITLSEGEYPFTPWNSAEGRHYDVENTKKDSTQKMEEALSAIAQELTRCKRLLQKSRQEPVDCKSGQSYPKQMDIELRPTTAQQNIGYTCTPYCNFTLHIGTVVLSDEAVLCSKNKQLVLTWKFYDQNVAMSRMRAGRVMLFDCSTEYNIKLTDEFVNYMKYEEMPILICEMDKPGEPFAGCSLPLRDALLHTNRRADMSLALVAGEVLKSTRAHVSVKDSLDAGDEVGVLDLWCALRARPDVLHRLNRAIATPYPDLQDVSSPRQSRQLQRVADDDPLEPLEVEDSRPMRNRYISANDNNDTKVAASAAESPRRSHLWGSSTLMLPSSSTKEPNITNAYPSYGSGSTASKKYTSQKDGPEEISLSEIVINEVETKIKTSKDLKQVMEKGTAHKLQRRGTDDSNSSVKHSSLSSMKSILFKLQRKNTPKEATSKKLNSDNPVREDGVKLSAGNINLEAHGAKQDTPNKEQDPIDVKHSYPRKASTARPDMSKKSVTIDMNQGREVPQKDISEADTQPSIDITILWLALNEECEAMIDSYVQRVYVAYTFLGHSGAELETPISLPKPKHYTDKCNFNFKKTFHLEDNDLPQLGHMARCRATSRVTPDSRDCIVFTVVSEPPEDPLGLESCEDIGYAYLYLGDLLEYSAGNTGYTEVIPVRSPTRGGVNICGVLAVRVDGLDVVQRCKRLTRHQREL